MTTIKARDMMREPLGDKPVSKLPGVGPLLAGKLTAQGYPLAVDVYQKFLNYKDRKRKFIKWLIVTVNAHQSQSSNIYDSLMRYHEEFGEIESESGTKQKYDAKRNLQGHVKRKGGAAKSNSVNFANTNANTEANNSSQSSDTDGTEVLEHAVRKKCENVTKSDAITSFVLPILESVKRFPRPLQLEVIRQFFEILITAENKLMKTDSEPVASTSLCNPSFPPQSANTADNTATSTHVLNSEATVQPVLNNFQRQNTATSMPVLNNNFQLNNTEPQAPTSVTIKQEKLDDNPDVSTSEA